MFKYSARIAAFALVLSLFAPAAAAEVVGAGASFVHPVMSKWSADYAKATNTRISYQAIGSGGGIAQIKAGTVDFGSSDAPLTPDELARHGLAQFPSVIGGVVPVINLSSVPTGALKLDGATLAQIFLGKLTMWNHPAIAALNPRVRLPALAITVVHRSDGSGTTFNFANYLSKVSPQWRKQVGEGTALEWPTGAGAKGNDGVARRVLQVDGSIGYVEMGYALHHAMPYARLRNAAGNFVDASVETFQAAAASADWTRAQDFHLVMTNAPGANAWPITATNFILMHKQPRDPAAARDAREFFRWAYANGDAQARQLDYVPLPDALVRQIDRYWSTQMDY